MLNRRSFTTSLSIRETLPAPQSNNSDVTDTPEPPTKRRCQRTRNHLQGDSNSEVVLSSDSAPEDTWTTTESETRSSDCEKAHITTRTLSHVDVRGPAYPLSQFQGWQPPMPGVAEQDAIWHLSQMHEQVHEGTSEIPEYTYFRLDDFRVYRPHSTNEVANHSAELVTLDKLQNRNGCQNFQFDGVLSCGERKYYVQGRPSSVLTIEGYGDSDISNLDNCICIQSLDGERYGVWYQLGTPAEEYRRFHEPFLWLAHFTKYFIDYLLEVENVTLEHFRERFLIWLRSRHGDKRDSNDGRELGAWLSYAGLHDFRTTIAANVGFLWKECFSIDDRESGLCEQPVWAEVDPGQFDAIPEQRSVEKRTLVSPFVFNCFKDMYFGHHLQRREIADDKIRKEVMQRKLELGLTPLGTLPTSCTTGLLTPVSLDETGDNHLKVHEGDVVCVNLEEGGHWKSQDNCGFAYVQGIHGSNNDTVLDILWLYRPSDTTFKQAYYPYQNELFLTDHCECKAGGIHLDCVKSKVEVNWFASDPRTVSGFFARQKFRTDVFDFVSLHKSHFHCDCNLPTDDFEECVAEYRVADTVLVRESKGNRDDDCLEPAQIADFDHQRQQVVLRRLLRKRLSDPKACANELVMTDVLFTKRPTRVVRKCDVLFIDPKDPIPAPYDRGGAGDLYFIKGQPFPLGLSNQRAWDPRAVVSKPKLRGMGIFCGGGNLDRGLEDGAAVEFDYAVDWAKCALHTYRANASNTATQYYLGSVNDFFAAALDGATACNVARPGQVDVIAAGSPCPGFSFMQLYPNSHQSLTNASMVASVVSFVDVYSPRYFFLENVIGMTTGMGPKRDQYVFAQILASLVAMGYQVQQFLMDAWSYGSPQSRSRVFVVALAPGVEPLSAPPHTHAHPNNDFREASLGHSSNGLRFGVRRDDYTPFRHMSARQAVCHLPSIGDGLPQLCPAYPDHRTPSVEIELHRTLMALVPTFPRGLGLIQAYHNGTLPTKAVKCVQRYGPVRRHRRSKTFSRIIPDLLFPTFTTAPGPADARCRVVHWSEHRSLTVMEARIAQGFLDHEVIVGSTRDQMKTIGNSVDRKVSLALGLVLRQSWEKIHGQDKIQDARVSERESSAAVENRKLVEQSRAGTLRLSDEQMKDVRNYGFKAIRQILEARVLN